MAGIILTGRTISSSAQSPPSNVTQLLRIDEELALLDRDANGAEVDRLAIRLASLEDPGKKENSEQRELRDLMQQQLKVLGRMRDSQNAVGNTRKQHLTTPQELWSAVSVAANDRGDTSHDRLADRVAQLAGKLRDESLIVGGSSSR